MSRSVRVDGRPLTWDRLSQMLAPEDPQATSPVRFDAANDLPLLDAQRLQAWLTRRGIVAEIALPVRESSLHWGERLHNGARRPAGARPPGDV